LLCAENMVRVIERKIIQKGSDGKQKLLRVSGRFELRQLSRVNLRQIYKGNPGKIDFGSSYRESNVPMFRYLTYFTNTVA